MPITTKEVDTVIDQLSKVRDYIDELKDDVAMLVEENNDDDGEINDKKLDNFLTAQDEDLDDAINNIEEAAAALQRLKDLITN